MKLSGKFTETAQTAWLTLCVYLKNQDSIKITLLKEQKLHEK